MNIHKKNLKNLTYFRAGPDQVNYVRPLTVVELTQTIKWFRDNNRKYKLIGKTTNLVFRDEISVEFIVDMTGLDDIDIINNRVIVQSGRLVSDVCRDALMLSLSGLEGLEGIPGTIGGALTMNAGAYSYFISDYLKTVTVLDYDLRVKVLSKEECGFGSRSSILFNSKQVILSAEFALRPRDRADIAAEMNRYHIARHKYQEWSYPNVGSNFVLDDDIVNILIKKESKLKRILFSALKNLLYNKHMRRFFWAIPHKSYINDLVTRRLDIDLFRFSRKNINTIVNYDGDVAKALESLNKMEDILGGQYKVETEIVE